MKNMNKIGKKQGFSLAEVLITLLIVSFLMIAMAPVITKISLPRKSEGIVYTYEPDNNIEINGADSTQACYMTENTFSDNFPFVEPKINYIPTKHCSEYTFKVPKGISKVNLTLVAGGGGGGGAAGGTIETYNVTNKTGTLEIDEDDNFILDFLKSVKINFLTARGQDAVEPSSSECSNAVCGSTGGSSSPAFIDFKLPSEYMRGSNYKNSMNPANSQDGRKLTLNIDNPDNPFINISNNTTGVDSVVTYSIASGNSLGCRITTKSVSNGNQEFVRLCKVPSNSIISSVFGQVGEQLSNSTKVQVNSIITGGTGGKNKTSLSGFGYGADGESKQVAGCEDGSSQCEIQNAKIVSLGKGIRGSAYADVTYEIERPGGTGGGGAGGAMVRILNFPVEEGEQYIVRVGKGGAGGIGGISSTGPNNGKNGEGGVSTAIYTSTGTLIYMVNGGAGGEGGKIYSTVSSSDDDKYGKIKGQSGRNIPTVFSTQAQYFDKAILDEGVAQIDAFPSDNNETAITSINQRRQLVYPFLNDEPYATMNRNGFVQNLSVKKLSGFSDFQIKDNPTLSGDYYDGLYFRSIADGTALYAGGLGGFSGLASKGGCGGFFIGNPNGSKHSNTTDNTDRKNNAFFVDGREYNVFDYYENCSAQTPNGATTPFVLPSLIDSKQSTANTKGRFGQAGSGGGGGGYSIETGAGNGGSGQNGYLMIDWRR